MDVIGNVIPIMHCNILFRFDESLLKLTIKIPMKKTVIYFRNIDDLSVWKSVSFISFIKTIHDLGDFRINDVLKEELLYNFYQNHNDLDNNHEEEYISILNKKIQTCEEKLNKLTSQRDTFINYSQIQKDSIEKPLDDLMNSEEWETVQDNYMNKRQKVRSYQSTNSFNLK